VPRTWRSGSTTLSPSPSSSGRLADGRAQHRRGGVDRLGTRGRRDAPRRQAGDGGGQGRGPGRVELFSPLMLASVTDRLNLTRTCATRWSARAARLLPAARLHAERSHRRLRGAGALAASDPRPGTARQLHPARRGDRGDQCHRHLVLRTACAQAATWCRAGHPIFHGRQRVGPELGRSDLVDRIEAVLFESGLPRTGSSRDHRVHRAAQPVEALESSTSSAGPGSASPSTTSHRLLQPQQAGHLPGRPAQDRSLIPERHQA